jgi:geranylgeranyl diphosphate synthase type II
MSTQVEEDIAMHLRLSAAEVDRALASHLDGLTSFPPRLLEAMRHSVTAGGKRLRPVLVLWCCELCGGRVEDAIPPAMAMECVHTFSLIHDDLPALDDDDVRRGQPSCHRQYGEALAILAGDALLALAFEILTENVSDAALSKAMMRELAGATGGAGMIGGEVLDLEGAAQPPDVEAVSRIHAAKTAALIRTACRLGGLAARADDRQMEALSRFGQALGLSFQVADDLLDVDGTLETTGKRTGKDADTGKQTYPAAIGVEESRRFARQASEQAIGALSSFGPRAARLVLLARHLVDRTS